MNPDLSPDVNIISNLDDMVDDGKTVLIGTHDGAFHCDEALAISMLNLVPHFSSNCVIRSRNPDVLQRCDILVDVGSVYDPTTHRYDHHQRSFADTFDGFNTKLSSAGLIYRHFGRAIIESLLSTGTEEFAPEEKEKLENLAPILYVLFPDTSGGWRVQAVPEVWSSFQSRKALPLLWCGLKDAELSQEVGIDGCKFVHTTGFIGGHDTREGAIAMVIRALDM
eukprot:gene12105-14025_t